MGGVIPGVLGVAAYGGLKFAGYSAAAWALKKVEPTVTTGIAKLAAARTALGFAFGPPATFLGAFLADRMFLTFTNQPYETTAHLRDAAIYGVLFFIRILVWALALYFFTSRKAPLPGTRFWLYSFLGAVISSLLDAPGYFLAIKMPGQITIC